MVYDAWIQQWDPFIKLQRRAYIDGPLTLQNTNEPFIDFKTTGNDWARIYFDEQTENAGYLSIETHDDGTEPIYVQQICDYNSANSRTLTLLDANSNTTLPGHLDIIKPCPNDGDTIGILIGKATGNYNSGGVFFENHNSTATNALTLVLYGGEWMYLNCYSIGMAAIQLFNNSYRCAHY